MSAKLRHVKLHNCFQHRDLELTFSDFHVLIGDNGSGKSNVIEAILYCLGCKFGLDGAKDTIVTTGEKSGRIDLTLEHESGEVQLRASVGSSSSRGLTAGDLKLTKIQDVQEYMQEAVLGTTYPVVTQAAAIRQKELEAGLFDTWARMMNAFSRLAGLSDIETKRTALSREKDRLIIPMLSLSLGSVEQTLQELTTAKETVQSEIETSSTAVQQTQLEYYRGIIHQYEQTTRVASELERTAKQLEEANSIKEQAEALTKRSATQLDDAEAAYAEVETKLDDAKAALVTYEEREKAWSKQVDIRQQIARLTGQLSQLVKPATSADEAYIAELTTAISKLDARILSEEQSLKGLNAHDGSTCPTCKKPYTAEEAAARANEAEEKLKEYAALKADANKALSDERAKLEEERRRQSEYEQEKRRIETQIKSATEWLEGSVDKPEKPEHAYTLVQTAEELRNQLETVRKGKQQADETLAAVNAEISVKQARYEELQSGLQELPSDASVEEARKFVQDAEAAQEHLAELRGRLTELDTQIAAQTERLEQLKENKARADKLSRYAEVLEGARCALHRDKYPSGKIRLFIDKMLVRTNQYLRVMQAKFAISFSNQGFIAEFPIGAKLQDRPVCQPASRLSGGERIIFALAFRFAVNTLHTDTGFLILDEPTAWLDDRHVTSVVEALQKLKNEIAGSVQVIIPTHDERLIAVAEKVSRIGA